MVYHNQQVVNEINMTGLRYFEIKGLFGRRNVELNFQKQVNIYIGENGLGKTTILKCIYYVLKRDFASLAKIKFDEIKVGFNGDPKLYSITLFDVLEFNRGKYKNIKYRDEHYLDMLFLDMGLSPEKIQEFSKDTIESIVRTISDGENIPPYAVRRALMHYVDMGRMSSESGLNRGNKEKVVQLSQAINYYVQDGIIYLPTCRRIENDGDTLNIPSKLALDPESLIRFGMDDVQKSIDAILEKIRKIAMDSYNEMTGVLLSQYTSGVTARSEAIQDIDPTIVRIVIDRLGNKIEKKTRNQILNLVGTKKIYEPRYKYLFNLIRKLIDNYDDQKQNDDRINGFVETCNKYLNDKKFIYDPSNLTLSVCVLDGKSLTDQVELVQLSSGEKQIVSLFSKLYLETEDASIVIIDEPELSLSLTWQKMLLPDIMRSNRCNLLITVTHSPFIFDNEFDFDAREIHSCETRGE